MEDNQFSTLSEAIENLDSRGYTLDFNLTSDSIECKELHKKFKPENFHIDEFHRFEGMTNPDDMSIVYAITTKDGKKGTMVDAYGAYSDPLTTEMVQKMRIH